jgi:hypothetical protein
MGGKEVGEALEAGSAGRLGRGHPRIVRARLGFIRVDESKTPRPHEAVGALSVLCGSYRSSCPRRERTPGGSRSCCR